MLCEWQDSGFYLTFISVCLALGFTSGDFIVDFHPLFIDRCWGRVVRYGLTSYNISLNQSSEVIMHSVFFDLKDFSIPSDFYFFEKNFISQNSFFVLCFDFWLGYRAGFSFLLGTSSEFSRQKSVGFFLLRLDCTPLISLVGPFPEIGISMASKIYQQLSLVRGQTVEIAICKYLIITLLQIHIPVDLFRWFRERWWWWKLAWLCQSYWARYPSTILGNCCSSDILRTYCITPKEQLLFHKTINLDLSRP